MIYIAGVTVNCIAILLVIGNALYDAFTLKNGSHNTWINLIGVVLVLVVLFSFTLKNEGKFMQATALVWVPGIPLLLTGLFLLLVIVVAPDWK